MENRALRSLRPARRKMAYSPFSLLAGNVGLARPGVFVDLLVRRRQPPRASLSSTCSSEIGPVCLPCLWFNTYEGDSLRFSLTRWKFGPTRPVFEVTKATASGLGVTKC